MHRLITQLGERGRNALSGAGAVLATECLLVCAIAAVAALLTWRLVPASASGIDTTIPSASPPDAEQATEPTAAIASLHLFGEPRTDSEETPEAVPTDAPETRLDLDLLGIYATGGGEGVAIIKVGNTREAVFGVGDRVAGEARVDGIYGDRVILERGGTLETLRLTSEDIATPAAPDGDAVQRASGNRDLQRIARHARELRSQLTRNPVELARMVRFQPYMRDGELVGYRLRPRSGNEQLLTQLGLEPSDVITAINGVELTNPGKAQQVLREMQSARSISVSWLRDGRQQQMTIPIGPSS